MGTRGHANVTLVILTVAAIAAVCLAACGRAATPRLPGEQAAITLTPVVAVDGGSIRGLSEGSLTVFRGVPFAAPPLGALRWRPPQRVRPWHGVLDCLSFRPACPQQLVPGLGVTPPGPQSEDCLYLNVWTPAADPTERLPVMVWIHGGGFVCGTADIGSAAARTLCCGGRVVLVSVTYRLGIFGYFALPALSAESPHHVSGNYGLLDQVAALRWVRRNIAAFGGDPRRVTVFGESAGGQSVISLLVSPLSRGLFARAISESPRYEDQGIGLWATRPLAEQEREGEAIARSLGAPPGRGQAAALRRESAARLLKAAKAAPRSTAEFFSQPPRPSFQPVVDGWALPREPWAMLRSGDWARVPLLVGSNQDEANMWFHTVPWADAWTAAAACRRRIAWYAGSRYATLSRQFTSSRLDDLVAETSRMMTVLEFNAPAAFTARLAARSGTPAYLYYFTWAPPADPWGATHGAELPYVFGVPPPLWRPGAVRTTEGTLDRQMSSYWTAFAAGGDPNGQGRPRWPRYAAKDGRLLIIGQVTRAGPVPYAAACAVADRINCAPRRR
jgi:para-nitrobenzyl esterase